MLHSLACRFNRSRKNGIPELLDFTLIDSSIPALQYSPVSFQSNRLSLTNRRFPLNKPAIQ